MVTVLRVGPSGAGEELAEAGGDLVGRVPFEQMAGAGDDLHRQPGGSAQRADAATGSSSSWSPQSSERRAGEAVEPAGVAAVAERPEQAGRGDVAEVAGHRALVGAEVAEAVDERLGHALGEEVAIRSAAGRA